MTVTATLLTPLSVLVTRPEHQSAIFCKLLHKAGATTALLPTIEIVYPAIASGHNYFANQDMLIFTSANAVHGASRIASPPWRNQCAAIAAIGPATARTLADYDIGVDITPAEPTSEGLLRTLSTRDLNSSRIAIIRGDSGRNLLFEQLQARGAKVQYVETYQRKLPSPEPSVISAAIEQTNVTTISSDMGLLNLVKLLPAGLLERLQRRPLITNSHRCAKFARQKGFLGHIDVAEPPGDMGQLKALTRYADLLTSQ